MSVISIKKINSRDELFAQVFALREKVLRQPLGQSLYNEDTSGDAQDDIFVALEHGNVIGCVMAKPLENGLIKLRQMAVEENRQKQGLGKLIVQAAEEDAKARHMKKISLHARKYAIGFYEQLGYHCYGTEFVEVGIPHMAMEKSL